MSPQRQFPRPSSSRRLRPVYVDHLPPCNQACPAGENIQAWLGLAQAGRYREAWETLVEDNPLPATMGRVCYHPCEGACNRLELDKAVNIHAVERFLGDRALAEAWTVAPARPSGFRVLVVGAGPAGLSAAWQLARRGHAVAIHDAGLTAGGMMHYGIPRYRLPRYVLDAEIARISALGVEIVLNHTIQDLMAAKAAGSFDAVFVALGAHRSRRQDIPGGGHVYDALRFLRDVESGTPPMLGRRVAVYGGGNTAMDAARTARRLGLEPFIVYRRTRVQMPAHAFEADDAIEEGIDIHWLRTIVGFDGATLTLELMTLDASGLPMPTGVVETMQADAVILALGQDTETAFLHAVPGLTFHKDGTVVVGPDMQTGCAGVFAGGDMVPYERTVTTAIGHGKKAARAIDAWLSGRVQVAPAKAAPAPWETLRLWYRTHAARRNQSRLDIAGRRVTFAEVVNGLDAGAASFEAARCLSCGNCFECDGCYAACRQHAVVKLGPGRRYRYDLDRCTGCGVCYDQCPCGAIDLVAEPTGPSAGA